MNQKKAIIVLAIVNLILLPLTITALCAGTLGGPAG